MAMSGAFLILWFFLVVSSALSPSEWRDVAVEMYAKTTRYFNEKDYSSFNKLVSADYEMVWPGDELHFGQGLAEEERRQHENVTFLYIAFVEVLYSSEHVAVVRHKGVREMSDGSRRRPHGMWILRTVNGEPKIQMTAFNYF